MSTSIDAIDKTPKTTVGTPRLGRDVERIDASNGRPNGPSFGSVLAAARPILKQAEASASVLPDGARHDTVENAIGNLR